MGDAADLLEPRLWELLQAGVDGEEAKMAEVFDGVVALGVHHLYAFMSGLAMVVRFRIEKEIGKIPPGTDWASMVFDMQTGKQINPEEAGAAPAFATRFVTAVCAGDSDLTWSVWEAFGAIDDEPVVSTGLSLVVDMAVESARRVQQINRGRS